MVLRKNVIGKGKHIHGSVYIMDLLINFQNKSICIVCLYIYKMFFKSLFNIYLINVKFFYVKISVPSMRIPYYLNI